MNTGGSLSGLPLGGGGGGGGGLSLLVHRHIHFVSYKTLTFIASQVAKQNEVRHRIMHLFKNKSANTHVVVVDLEILQWLAIQRITPLIPRLNTVSFPG